MRWKENFKKVERWENVERKIDRGIFTKVKVLPVDLPDFQAPPLSLPALGGPSNPKGTIGQTFSYTYRPDPGNEFFPVSSYQAGTGT